MVMTRSDPNAPITFSGQLVAYDHDSTYTEHIMKPNISDSTPLQFSEAKIRYAASSGDPSDYTNE